MSQPFSPSRSQPTLSRSVLSTISRLFATPMADQLTESQSMPDVPLTEFPPSRRRGIIMTTLILSGTHYAILYNATIVLIYVIYFPRSGSETIIWNPQGIPGSLISENPDI
ncbi:hypothetical protein EDB92DRAFT_1817085 [Lactarius akahatsu]|uniref:Uncharacterized protein n=1 Tax=Lactarius akahatsu TaxID=416441 RepID=A0AAD4LFD8_9AGAM|nr:hypothetical protein EDB92DRAFT_1817085 [Lactarius akahatsu]